MSKGPYKYSEISGSKCTSKSQGILKSGQGKMSATHGSAGGSNQHNMNQTHGGYLIGKGNRTFRAGLLPTAAPGHGAGHKSQPKGHGKM